MIDGAKVEGLAEFYTPKVSGQTVTLALNEKARPVIGEATVKKDDETERTEPAIGFDENGNFTVTVKGPYKKLHYKMQGSTDLSSWHDVEGQSRSNTDANFQFNSNGSDYKFFKIVVTDH